MKAKNFTEGAMVRIKPNATEWGLPESMVGQTGALEVCSCGVSEPHGRLSGSSWVFNSNHVSLVKSDTPDAPDLTRGYYVDGDGDLWVIAGNPLRAANVISARQVSERFIEPTDMGDGLSIPDLIYMHSDKPWWPLRKVAYLPE